MSKPYVYCHKSSDGDGYYAGVKTYYDVLLATSKSDYSAIAALRQLVERVAADTWIEDGDVAHILKEVGKAIQRELGGECEG